MLVVLLLVLSGNAWCTTIEINELAHDSIHFTFTNARFVNYNGTRSFSIDVEAEVKTTFRSRDIAFSELELIMLDGDANKIISVTPIMFNSTTFGTVFKLDQSGSKVSTATDVADRAVKAVEVDSGKRHKGTLLFYLPEEFSMIMSLAYKSSNAAVRKAENAYIDLPMEAISSKHIYDELASTEVATNGTVILLEILQKMTEFANLNEPLKAAW